MRRNHWQCNEGEALKMFDSHVHVMEDKVDFEGLLERLRRNNVKGCALLSLPPKAFPSVSKRMTKPADRLENIMSWCSVDRGAKSNVELFPFFWVDPLEDDAAEQVEKADKAGAAGFKIIMNRDYPSHPQAMGIFGRIAKTGKAAIIHTGILWDGRPSSRYNRPSEYECLLDIPRIRFSLCHMSWPWLDECLAVYGKFLHAMKVNPKISSEMFIDLTPGTPKIYRREALIKLFTIGYDVEDNILFGTDCFASAYDVKWLKDWHAMDSQIMSDLGVRQEAVEKYYGRNFLRFIGRAGTEKNIE